MHKERDYSFVFGAMAFMVFVGISLSVVCLSNPVMPSHITISVEPTTVTVGENVTISGFLLPKRSDVSIRIRWLSPTASWGTLTTAGTNKDGQFSYVWTPEVAGTYKLRTEWLGDQTTSYTISRIVVVTVVEGETE